jgi:hypothetical protein
MDFFGSPARTQNIPEAMLGELIFVLSFTKPKQQMLFRKRGYFGHTVTLERCTVWQKYFLLVADLGGKMSKVKKQ